MRTLIAAALMAVLAVPAFSQARCAPRDLIVTQLAEKYGEAPIGRGLNRSNIILEIWVNTETGTWTALTSDASGRACIQGAGKDWISLDESANVEGAAL